MTSQLIGRKIVLEHSCFPLNIIHSIPFQVRENANRDHESRQFIQ
ncbi:hypothetical protein X975_07777, partial [Stegodyphus mimosarum]